MRKSFYIFLCCIFSLVSLYANTDVIEDLEQAFENVAKKVGPSVVSISTIRTYKIQEKYIVEPFGFSDQSLQNFLSRYLFLPPEAEIQKYSLGSGIIVREDGYILTNKHVVEGANEIEVTLTDGRKFKAAVKGKDSRSDLAILKIEMSDLPIAKLGDSSKAKTGQWVVAIGNPFGFLLHDNQPTVTVGVISATHRKIPEVGLGRGPYYYDLIQTDAAINPGNSGGPLVNLKGEVVGINMAIFSASGSYSGVGFAVPVNVAKDILNTLIAGEQVLYGWLGVGVGPVDKRIVKDLNIPNKKGALILKIFEKSPAEKSKIQELDVIYKINEIDISSPKDLIQEIAKMKAGVKVNIKIIRKGQKMELDVILESHPLEKFKTS